VAVRLGSPLLDRENDVADEEEPMSSQPPNSRLRQPGFGGVRPARVAAGVLLLIGIVVPLMVPTYARRDPELWGFPFFYWYQLAWVFLAAILVGVAFVLVRRDERVHRAELTHGRVLGEQDPLDEQLGTGDQR
jgi:hypothetical protein